MRAPPESLRPDHGRAHLHREVHDLADLAGVRLGEAAAEDREVLGEDVHEAPVHASVAGHDAVAGHLLLGHAEVEAAVLDELVELLEGALVEQHQDALAGGELALAVLPLAPLGAAPLLRAPGAFPQVVEGEHGRAVLQLRRRPRRRRGPRRSRRRPGRTPRRRTRRRRGSRRRGHREDRELLLDVGARAGGAGDRLSEAAHQLLEAAPQPGQAYS